MKISLPLFICLFHVINSVKCNSTLMKYLDDQAKIVSAKLIRHARNQENFYTVKFNDTNTVELIGNYTKGEIFSFFGTAYAVMDREVYKITQNNYSRIHIILPDDNIILLKSIEFQNTGFLVFATKTNLLHIFGFNNKTKDFFKIQNLVHLNVTDMELFECQNQLYLIVANYQSSDFTSIVVYKFMHSHFDETEKFFASGATNLHTFHNNGSEIIMVLQKSGVTASLYEFKHDRIRKIQKIDTDNADEVLNYSYFGEQYLMIFTDTTSVSVYFWTGSDLLFWEQYTTGFALTGSKSVFYINNSPYLLVNNNTKFVIFTLSDKFLQIYDSEFNSNWTNIWTHKFIGPNVFGVSGKTVQNRVEIKTVSVSIGVAEQHENVVEEKKLSSCFLTLEKAVYVLRNKITELENSSRLLMRDTDDDTSQSGFSFRKWEELQNKYSTIKLKAHNKKSQTLVINKTAILDFPLGAKKVTAKNIHFDTLNNQKWQPHKWLSYSLPQIVSGPVKAHVLHTDTLKTNQPLFNDLLLANGNQIVSGFITTNNLQANDIETKSLNNISVDNIYYKSQPVTIQGLKSFPELKAKNIDTATINGIPGTRVAKLLTNSSILKYSFAENVKIDNLWVQNIDGVNFDEFRNSVFRIGHGDTIDGNLIFTQLQAKEMFFKTLSNQSSFFTTSTNQTVTSSITISKIFAENVKTTTINGIDFRNSVATFNDNTIIGPVSIKHLNVTNNLHLNGTVGREFLLINDTHIVGTNESDFLQRYNGNVTIKGNLIVKNFDLGKNAHIFVAGKEFDPKMEQFWTKSTQQTIHTHFEARNGMSVPHLFTEFINEVRVNDYLLNGTEQKKGSKFYFESVIVKGNVFLNSSEQHSPNFERIQKEGVRTNGTFVISGRKTYSNTLKVDALEISHLQTRNSTIVLKKKPLQTFGPRRISNLIVKGDFTFDNITVETINDVDLQNLVENTVYIDVPQNISKLTFENITGHSVFVNSELNGNKMDALTAKLKVVDTLDEIDFVYVTDNVTITNVEKLSTINNRKVSDLLAKSSAQYQNNTIHNTVKFLGKVKVKDLYIVNVNNVNLQNLSKRMLYKSWNQPIVAHFTFTTLKTTNLISEQINDFNMKNIVDVSSSQPQTISASHGLTISSRTKIKNLVGNFSCDISESLNNLHNPLSQFWNKVTVIGNATFWDRESLVSRIFDKVVTREKNNPVIEGQVTFTNHISVNNITTLKTINDVDIMEIIEDAFLNKPDIEQVITGRKTFSQIEANEMKSLRNTNVSAINDINILDVQSKIVTKNSILKGPIRGQKVFFGGLQTDKIETDFISGIEAKNLVSFDDPKKVPNAMFESLSVVDNFNITYINGMPLDVLLNERLLKDAPKQVVIGNYFFRKISFRGNIETPHINDINIDNMVYDKGTQTISSPKRFINDLIIAGNMRTELINGLDLSKSYEQAALKNEKTNFTGIMRMMKPILLEGNIQTNYINNVPMEYMLDTNAKYSLQVEAHQIHEITKILTRFIHKYLNSTIRLPTEIIYLEKSTELQIPLPNVINARLAETKNEILIHLESEEIGSFCGLPQTCKCPVQQTMQIASERSINIFMNKATQRIYSYFNDDIIIHVITHSVSTSSYCRTSKKKVINEVSSLTWNLPPRENSTGGFFIHRGFFHGFISGVEFFTIYGRTYVVIGIYYDPVLDTHNADTLVLRFNGDKTELEEIQKIPTVGMKTVSLFPTAQGVVLIMGSEISDLSDNFTNTHIFRFNHQKQLFELLRDIPTFGSIYAEGVVLERDSLIILANKRATLLILKYQPDFDNYYLYQTFKLDYSISSLSVFYAEGFGISDAYLCLVTTNGEYFIYSYWFIEGWKLEFSGELDDVRVLVPFKLNKKSYLLAPSAKRSSLLTLVEHDFS
ncbi:uncharacterized protein LOC135141748 [Zophobas morio]|uniref:uncharacterized protein LOC135141748 n=1 Tax=Zophobas morio TaxID=2755281 RepID=UPI003082E10D